MKLVALLPLLSFGAAAQLPFRSTVDFLARESSSASIGSSEFTTLKHEDFPSHSVRVKNTTGYCDDGAKSYSGYIDIKLRKSIFFQYFESREAPSTAPLAVWFTGGPGCSGAVGQFFELGPCQLRRDGNKSIVTAVNPSSWTNKANMIFIDEPTNVGFSHSAVDVGTSEQAGIDIAAFLSVFIEAFKFEGRELHLVGESYAGRYIPVFAAELVSQNQALAASESKRAPYNLKSVAIGNGLTDFVTMTTAYYIQSCTRDSGVGKPILPIKTCTRMQSNIKRCDKWLQRVCRDSVSQPECAIASEYCGAIFEGSFFEESGLNPYDITKTCTLESLATDLCYPKMRIVNEFLDLDSTRKLLGVDPGVGKYESCSNRVGSAFAATNDGAAATFYQITGLLEAGVQVLIYNGKLDWICNFAGNEAWLKALEWSGMKGFAAEEMRSWSVGGSKEVAGETKSFGGLTYTTINKAGHMVPMDQPEQAAHLFENWLAGKSV